MKEKFARIWDAYLADVLRALADGAFELLLGQVSLAYEATDLAHVHLVVVGDIEEALFEEAGSSVRNHAVTLHLTESQATITTTPFSWLTGQDLGWSTATRVHFVLHHMLESLVISWTKEDHDFHLLACESIVHDLVTS